MATATAATAINGRPMEGKQVEERRLRKGNDERPRLRRDPADHRDSGDRPRPSRGPRARPREAGEHGARRRARPTIAQGPIVPGQFADLAVHGDYAYLNSWDEPSCTKGGTYIADISDPANPWRPASSPPSTATTTARARTWSRSTRPSSPATCSPSTTRPAERRDPPARRRRGLRRLRPLRRQRSVDPGDADPERRRHTEAGPPGQLLPQRLRLAGRATRPSSSPPTTPSSRTSTSSTSPTRPHRSRSKTSTSRSTSPRSSTSSPTATSLPSRRGGEGDRWRDADAGLLLGRRLRAARTSTTRRTRPTSPTPTSTTPTADRLRSAEGNAHQAEYSHNNEFILAGDEDFSAFRATNTITEAPFDGVKFAAAVSAAEPIPDGTTIAGDTVFVGSACTGTVAPPPAGVTIAVAERGVCAGGFQEKIDAIEAAGHELAVIFNNSFGAGWRPLRRPGTCSSTDRGRHPGDLRRPGRRAQDPRHLRPGHISVHRSCGRDAGRHRPRRRWAPAD